MEPVYSLGELALGTALPHDGNTEGMTVGVICKNCGGAHPVWDCSKPTKSAASRMDEKSVRQTGVLSIAAGTQAPPADGLLKPKMGRPRTGYIKAEYNRQYSADQRTIKRLGLNCTVSEYRRKRANGEV